MSNWFYYDSMGNKQGPINDQQLRLLISEQKIIPETRLETENGHQGLAKQIPGLFPVASPFTRTQQASPFSVPNPNVPNSEYEETNTNHKSRISAGLFALLAGGVGAHKFYLGSWGWGIIYILVVILTSGAGLVLTELISFVEGIIYLCKDDNSFNAKYSKETQSAFRW